MTTALSVRTHFSLKESIIDPSKIGELAKEHGYDSVAIVDNMSVNGLVDLTKSCKSAGVKPIIGCRVLVYDDPAFKETKADAKVAENPNAFWSPKLYAKNEEGMKSIIKLLARANLDDYFYYTPRTGLKELLEVVEGGNVILLSGDVYGLFSHKSYADIADKLRAACSGSDFVIELVPLDTPLYEKMNRRALKYAQVHSVEIVATRPVLYASDDDADSLDVIAAITSQKDMATLLRPIPYKRDLSFKPVGVLRDELEALLLRCGWDKSDVPMQAQSIIDMADTIAAQCQYEWKELPVSLPEMAEDEMQTLIDLVKQGWNERLTNPVMGYQPSDLKPYKERLKYELGVLKKMKFERYFLLVSDITRWCKENGVPMGPGRGSAAGSLVSYLLKITDVDPLRFNLIFERFINPDRIDLPDIDMDFASSKRQQVIDYIKDKYGEDYVAGISNYVTVGTASGIRDIGKAFGLMPFDMTCTKLMPKEHGEMIDLDIAADMVPEIEKFKNNHPEVWGHAQKLVGTLRNYGKHAAGVVIAGEPIRNRAVMERRSGDIVVNWDRNSTEKWGLIKIDVLGLSTLDVIDIAVKSIKSRLGVDINTLSIPLDDEKTLQAFSEGKTIGVFQFEGGGVRNLLKQLALYERLTFDDISAATALYRPGPMDAGLMDEYISYKQGASPHYAHPNMEDALRSTGGVMVYQEQIQRIARDLAGFTMAEADGIRKAVGKKDKDKMATFRTQFVEGCIKNGTTERVAEKVWDDIEKFAGYGFNLSHSVSYALISYQAMWLKTHYPLDFFGASMSILDEDKMPALVADANAHGIEIYPPDINISSDKFEISKDHTGKEILVIPFNRVKGVSSITAQRIVDVRNRVGGFKSDADLFDNIEKRHCNSKVQDVLRRVGAFANITPGEKPPRHPDRLKDQIELMPGLSSTYVSVTRRMPRDKFTMQSIGDLYAGLRNCQDCSLKGGVHPLPGFGKKAEFMVITDCPTKNEDGANKMLSGDGANFIKSAIQTAGLKVGDGYFTSMVKSIKNGQTLSNDQINGCSKYLDEEIKILKPAIIVLMGNSVIKRFLPNEKKPADVRGKVVYSKELDANLVIGMNPAVVWFDQDKQNWVDEIFMKVSDLLNM